MKPSTWWPVGREFAMIALTSACVGFLGRADEARLLRFPTIHGNQIVFTYAGDLYTVSAAGGIARRLTSDVGYEMFPRFSPDGKWIAFTAQYDGNTEVYLMPAGGGIPQRLTYTPSISRDDVSDRMGPNNIVMTWQDERTIIFRSRSWEWNDFNGQLFQVSIDGGFPAQLPLPRGGWCSFSPDKKKLAYNRVFREFRTWKRYRGGQADDIWIHDFTTKITTNLTQNTAQDIFPMWRGNRIYFVSDRDDHKKMNLYVFDPTAKSAVRKLTSFIEFDVKFPSLGDQAIVFENGGYIYRFDLASEKTLKVPISIQEDLVSGRGGLKDVSKEITDFGLSPDGNRAWFVARGDVFTVPARYGNTRNLTRSSGVHERNAQWSPDGKWIACISDASGEDEIYLLPQDGLGPALQLTINGDTYKYGPVWSPDSKKLLWSDKKQRLQYVEVETKQVTQVVQAAAWEIRSYHWSPDSRWIAYVKPEVRQMPRIYLYSVLDQDTYPVTDGWFASSDPVFSPNGKYLFFVSNRSFTPRYSQTEPDHAYVDLEAIYLVTLAQDTPSPFAPKSDEVKVKTDEKERDKPAKESRVILKVDPAGLSDRIALLPVRAASYRHLTPVAERLYYARHGTKDERARVLVYDLEKEKETDLGEFSGFEVSADGRKMLVASDHTYTLIETPVTRPDPKEHLLLTGLKVELDRQAEWSQIYRECWRQMRDFVYDPHLHGLDWPKIRARYEPLVPYVNHRADLTYLIGEMISEINLGHCYVGGGDYPKPERVPVGLLGAKLERDPASGYYRVKQVLKGRNWDKSLRSPLTDIGVEVQEGDYIIAVNGEPANRLKNLYAALVNTAGKQVMLKVNSQPQVEGSHQTVVVPTSEERPLYYLNWVLRNLERVAKATDDKVGYVHIPNMGVEGLNEFVKFYYPQLSKDALIVDVRGNGGGNVSSQIIERLRREPAFVTIARNGAMNVDPAGMMLGPKAMLLDEFAASDGDIVAYRFKKYKLGPVIGKRSWGGVVGIRSTLPLLDGGYLNRPEFSRYDLEGKEWIMEGKGVEPDLFVDNDPAREFAGIDDQLEKAIAVIKEELKKHPVALPPPPPYPDKSK